MTIVTRGFVSPCPQSCAKRKENTANLRKVTFPQHFTFRGPLGQSFDSQVRYRGWQDGLRVRGGLDVDGQPGGVGRRPERGRHCQITLQRPQGMQSQTPPSAETVRYSLNHLYGSRL